MAAAFMNSHLNTMGNVTLVSNRELNLSRKKKNDEQQLVANMICHFGGSFYMLFSDCKWGFTQFLGPETITQVEYLTSTLQHGGSI